MSELFLVEVIIGNSNNEPFCKIIVLPANIHSDMHNLTFCYGDQKGDFKRDVLTHKYIVTLDNAKLYDTIILFNSTQKEVIHLICLTEELPASKLLLDAYLHLEKSLEKDLAKYKVHIKILADASGNAYYYIGFSSNQNFAAILFNPHTLEIIADYIK